MAEHLARVFGTEEDPVNCAFYFKVGACRHGDMCSKKHNRPTSSRTLLLTNMYPNPPEALAIGNEEPWDDAMYDRAQLHVEQFYEEVVLVLAEYGEIEEVVVVDNTIEYMQGNVYVKYYHEDAAERALKGLTGRLYFGKLINAEYSPVTDFREARCRAFHETRCSRGGSCRFLHIKHIPTAVKRRVAREMYDEHPEYVHRAHSRYQKERSRSYHRNRERHRPRAIQDRERVPALMDAPADSRGGGRTYSSAEPRQSRADSRDRGRRDRDRDRDRQRSPGQETKDRPEGAQKDRERAARDRSQEKDREKRERSAEKDQGKSQDTSEKTETKDRAAREPARDRRRGVSPNVQLRSPEPEQAAGGRCRGGRERGREQGEDDGAAAARRASTRRRSMVVE
uniref:Uncharacterized protein n=1 Tax=Pyrodinium bahamense TaxID=73915 RepID=A0A7S0FRU4_9DINO